MAVEELEQEELSSTDLLVSKMTPKQYRWCESYLTHFDAHRATLEVYDVSDPSDRSVTKYNRAHPLLRSYLAKRLEERRLGANEVLALIREIATASIEDFISFRDGFKIPFFDLEKARQSGKLHLVKRIRYLKQGGIEVELYDKTWALELLAKHNELLRPSEVNISNYRIEIVREDRKALPETVDGEFVEVVDERDDEDG